MSSPVASGLAAAGADPIRANACNRLETNAGTILYSGLTPGFPGLYQLNVQVVTQNLLSGVNYFYLFSQGRWVATAPQSATHSNLVGVYVP